MIKKLALLSTVFFINAAFANSYSTDVSGTIHITTIQSRWCGNMTVSTKVGKWSHGQCNFSKETSAEAYDDCRPLKLNPTYLKLDAGQGYDCAATHVHSNDTKTHDSYDPFRLISKDGEYVGTIPYQGNITMN